MSGGEEGLRIGPDLAAAILWDLPALQDGDAAARNLVVAFGPQPRELDGAAGGPLQIAAEGILEMATGDEAAALRSWAGLIAADEPGERLLGHLLRLLVITRADERERDLNESRAIAATVAEPEIRARITRKVAIAALDSGHTEVARAALSTVVDSVPTESRLGRSLRWLLWVAGDREVELPRGKGGPDPLLDQPWLVSQSFSGAVEADLNRFRDGLSGTWGGTIRLGQTPMDVLIAAQRQADWAGEHGLRNSVVQVMAAHILEDPHRYQANVRWAATSWIISGGRQISGVLRRAEPYLDAAAATELVDVLVQRPSAASSLPEVAAAVWRLVSDEDSVQLLDLLDPGDPSDPTHQEARLVWANVIWRGPDAWFARWQDLQGERQLGALVELLPDVADELAKETRSELLGACERAPETERSRVAGIAAALAWKDRRDASDWLQAANTGTILELLRWKPEAVDPAVLGKRLEDLKRLVGEQRDAALSGSFGLGSVDPRTALGTMVAAAGRRDPEAERLLVVVAEDPRMSAEHQISALQGLVSIRRARLLSDEGRAQARSMSGEQGRHLWGPIDTGAVRAATLYVLADDLTEAELDELLSGARSPAEQVRLISIAALEDVLQPDSSDAAAAWTLVSALYDPSDEVIAFAASALGRGSLRGQSDARSVAVSALITAYRTGRHAVRRAVVSAAWVLREEYSAAAQLIETATTDSSWEVRRAAAGWDWRKRG